MLSGNAYSIPCISSRFKLINRVWLLYRDKKTVTIMTKKTTKKKKKNKNRIVFGSDVQYKVIVSISSLFTMNMI